MLNTSGNRQDTGRQRAPMNSFLVSSVIARCEECGELQVWGQSCGFRFPARARHYTARVTVGEGACGTGRPGTHGGWRLEVCPY